MPEQCNHRLQNGLAAESQFGMQHDPIHEDDVIDHFECLQVGPNLSLLVGQRPIDLVQALGVAIADLEQRLAVDLGVCPEDLGGQKSSHDEFLPQLVECQNADFQLSDVIPEM